MSALSAKVLRALGACRMPEMRRNSSKLSRFQPNITVFERNISRQKASRGSGQAARLVHRVWSDRGCLWCASCVRRWPQLCCFSKFCKQNRANFDREIAQFRCRRCAQDARYARRLIPKTSKAVPRTSALSAKVLRALGACRVPKMRRNSSKLSRFELDITVFERNISRQRASRSSGRAARLVHRVWSDRGCLRCASCVR